MVKLDLDVLTMYDVYTKEVRSILELAVPVWHSGLTKTQSKDIERIQRISFQIILGPKYNSYTQDLPIPLCPNTSRKESQAVSEIRQKKP